jgi:hypothetical protein
MHDDDRDLANRLFATAMLEDAVEMAVAGQSQQLGPSDLANSGRRLGAVAHDVAVSAEAAAIAADPDVNSPPARQIDGTERTGLPGQSKRSYWPTKGPSPVHSHPDRLAGGTSGGGSAAIRAAQNTEGGSNEQIPKNPQTCWDGTSHRNVPTEQARIAAPQPTCPSECPGLR